jgi:hypothetical protein
MKSVDEQRYLKSRFKNKFYKIIAIKHGLKRLSSSKFIKKSDTVFVFGSGASLSALSDKDWLLFSKHNTIGVNMSIVHDFPVDLVFWEILKDSTMNEMFVDRVLKRTLSKTRVVLNINHAVYTHFFSTNLWKKLKIRSNVFGYVPVNLKLSKPNIKRFYRLYNKYRSNLNSESIIHHCTHIGAAVDYSAILGFKRIVLVGCDLNGGKYFTEVESNSSLYPTTELYATLNKARRAYSIRKNELFGDIHPSNNKEITNSNGALTAKEYFFVVNEIYKQIDVELLVYDNKSSLSEFLKIYNSKGR